MGGQGLQLLDAIEVPTTMANGLKPISIFQAESKIYKKVSVYHRIYLEISGKIESRVN